MNTVCATPRNRTEESIEYINALCNADTKFGVNFFHITAPHNPVWLIIAQATVIRLLFYVWNHYVSRGMLAKCLKLLDCYCHDNPSGHIEQSKETTEEIEDHAKLEAETKSETQSVNPKATSADKKALEPKHKTKPTSKTKNKTQSETENSKDDIKKLSEKKSEKVFRNRPVDQIKEAVVVNYFTGCWQCKFIFCILTKILFSLAVITASLDLSILYLSNLPTDGRYICQGSEVEYSCIYHALNLVKPVIFINAVLTSLSGLKLSLFVCKKLKFLLCGNCSCCKGNPNKPENSMENGKVTDLTLQNFKPYYSPRKGEICPNMKALHDCFQKVKSRKPPRFLYIFLLDYAEWDHVNQDECKCVSIY